MLDSGQPPSGWFSEDQSLTRNYFLFLNNFLCPTHPTLVLGSIKGTTLRCCLLNLAYTKHAISDCKNENTPPVLMAPSLRAGPTYLPSPRCFLLNEIEKEEKEKLWYYSQLQGLSKRLDELPHVETVSARGGRGRRGEVPWVGPAPGQGRGEQAPGHQAPAAPHRGLPAPPSSSPCRWT